MAKNTGRDLAIGVGAGIIGALANEHLSARPRIAQAAREGYAQGYSRRDAELRPEIVRISSQNAQLRAEVARLATQLEGDRAGFKALITRVIAAIPSEPLRRQLEGQFLKALPPGSR